MFCNTAAFHICIALLNDCLLIASPQVVEYEDGRDLESLTKFVEVCPSASRRSPSRAAGPAQRRRARHGRRTRPRRVLDWHMLALRGAQSAVSTFRQWCSRRRGMTLWITGLMRGRRARPTRSVMPCSISRATPPVCWRSAAGSCGAASAHCQQRCEPNKIITTN